MASHPQAKCTPLPCFFVPQALERHEQRRRCVPVVAGKSQIKDDLYSLLAFLSRLKSYTVLIPQTNLQRTDILPQTNIAPETLGIGR